jgi:hypothetical protein
MTHSLPDYTTKYKLTSLFASIDNAELAVRLKSIHSHDRRGSVLWMDDFEGSVLRWEPTCSGAGSGVALSTTYQRSGIQSAACTTGPGGSDYAGLRRSLTYPTLSPLGFEISFKPTTLIDYYLMTAIVHTGSIYYYSAIMLDVTNDALKYLTTGGAYTQFSADCPLALISNLFMTIKLVIDPVTGYYKRFMLNNVTHDLSANAIRTVASATDPYYYFQFQCINSSASSRVMYVDDAIMTIDEP